MIYMCVSQITDNFIGEDLKFCVKRYGSNQIKEKKNSNVSSNQNKISKTFRDRHVNPSKAKAMQGTLAHYLKTLCPTSIISFRH